MRKASTMLATAVAVLLTAPTYAESSSYQESLEWLGYNPSPTFPLSPPEAPHRHSSTYQEGLLRGYAALTRAQGDFNVLDAQAEILWQQAYAMHMMNQLFKTDAAFARKQKIRDYYHEDRVARLMHTEELHRLRQVAEARRDLEKALEYPLTEFDVNFRTGAVYWPALVSGPRYAKYRAELNDLMALILRNGAFSTVAVRERLKDLCNEFRDQLQKDLAMQLADEMSTVGDQYEDVRQLLYGLRYSPVVMTHSMASESLSMR